LSRATRRALRSIESFVAVDVHRVRANHRLLARLAIRDDVKVFSAHDRVEYDPLRAGEGRVPD